ncbi:glycine cleavage system protein H [Candidatus Bathyarchaeota archaeon]|nr:MAG: glycine cleavage system protein H [Candidatus Bathyarchaeota archaeon]
MKGEYSVPDGLYYTKEHEWVRVEENKCRVQSLGTVESVKAVADVYSPVSGEVVEVNDTLSDAPELVNKTPYSEGWITVIKPEDLKKDLPGLMRPEDYRSLLKEITEKK